MMLLSAGCTSADREYMINHVVIAPTPRPQPAAVVPASIAPDIALVQ
ncbi:MAG TPA: hypothetical protein VFG14_19395 [Chthoniobacteraceae bacterium]|nr:hypothetical protein [Chthoniobacteraceae bacterium]